MVLIEGLSLKNRISLIQLGWLANEIQGFTSLCLSQSWGYGWCDQLFVWVMGFKFRPYVYMADTAI